MATISLNEWTRYRELMSKICTEAGEKFRDFAFKQHAGLGSLDRQEVLDYAYNLITEYGKASGALACEFYDMVAEMQGASVPAAEMAEISEYGEVAKAVNGAAKQGELNTPGVIQRMVKQVAADTMLQNAKRDGAYFAWIPGGDKTCAYCLMMSAIGWQKAGKTTLNGKHAKHIHANCKCQYQVDFKGDMVIEGYDPDALAKEIAEIVDSEATEEWGADDVFDEFLRQNGRQTWSSEGYDRTGLNVIQTYLNNHKKIN